ncbi:MAG: NAD(P)-dependent malic enzyme [Candidatus Micrarchaeia archaeon]
MDYYEKAIELARTYKGKIGIKPKVRIRSYKDFSLLYTPGVAGVSKLIKEKNERFLTYKWNSVAIVTDGTRVLGLGDIGPDAAMPVMEGKALLFKYLGGVDAIPITLGTKDKNAIVEAVKSIAPSFSGINLEDIESPKSFEILDRLQKELNMPVWHDDNQGTAAAALAAFINAMKLVNKNASEVKVLFIGAGTANLSTYRLLKEYGINPKKAILVDSKGVLYKGRADEDELRQKNPEKYKVMQETNGEDARNIEDAAKGADVIIGASTKGAIKEDWIRSMNSDAIVFALANPEPEIERKKALRAGARIYASGRSDMPNQVNNSLIFPGVFRGVLDVQAKKITDKMAITGAIELAKYAEEKGLSYDYIIPKMSESEAYYRLAAAVGVEAQKEGLAEVSASYDELYQKAKEIIESSRKWK